MTQLDFKMTKLVQIASEHGLDWFSNGASKQIVYIVTLSGRTVKTLISTEYDKTMYCHIIKIDNIKGGAPYLEYRFSVNPKKKFWNETFVIINADGK